MVFEISSPLACPPCIHSAFNHGLWNFKSFTLPSTLFNYGLWNFKSFTLPSTFLIMVFEISSPLLCFLVYTLSIMVFEISSPSVCLPWVVWNFKSLVFLAVVGNFCCCWCVEPEEAICGKSQNEDWLSCWLNFYHHFAWFWKDHFGKKE